MRAAPVHTSRPRVDAPYPFTRAVPFPKFNMMVRIPPDDTAACRHCFLPMLERLTMVALQRVRAVTHAVSVHINHSRCYGVFPFTPVHSASPVAVYMPRIKIDSSPP